MALGEPFRLRSFRIVWASQLVNVLGDALFDVAFALFIIDRYGSASAVGLLLGCLSLGSVVALLFGGALADRHRRTRVIVASDLVRMAGLVWLILVGPNFSQEALIAPALLLGIGGGLYRPAFGAILPTIVPRELLGPANAVRALTNRLAFVVGGALGGLLADVVTPLTVMVLDSLTFLVSIAAMLSIREIAPKHHDGVRSLFGDIKAGIVYVKSMPWISAVMIQGMLQVTLVASVVTVALPLVYGQTSGMTFGGIVSLEGAGAMLGAMLGAKVKAARRGLIAMLSLAFQLPQIVAIWANASFLVIGPLSALAGAGLSIFAVVWTSALQQEVPERWLGRVMSLDTLTATALAPVGLAGAGYGLGWLGIQPAMILGMIVLAGSIVLALLVPGVDSFRSQQSAIDIPINQSGKGGYANECDSTVRKCG